MEACSVARIMSLWSLAINRRNLCSLIFSVLPKLLGLPLSLLKEFLKDEHVHPPLMETKVGTLPELTQDFLMDIFATLEIPDLVRAGSVCSSWRAAYTSLRSLGQYKQHQTPCLLYTSESAGENVACIYSLTEQRAYKLTLPEPPIRSRYLIGSSHGWVVTADERSELHLLNPITGEQIALPSVTTIEHVKPVFDDSGTIYHYELSGHTEEKVYEEPSSYALNDLRDFLYVKALVFTDPSTGSYIVVLIHHPYHQLSFARAGDDKWTWLPFNIHYTDCTYMDGLLYALTTGGEIDAFDLTATTVTMKVIIKKVKHYIYESMYIIQAPWGDLLQIWRTVDVPEDYVPLVLHTRKVIIYKVDIAAKELLEINSLQDHVMFLGHNQTLCLRAEEYPQLKADHVYFTDDNEEWINLTKNEPRDIGVFDLEHSSRKEIVSPQIWSNWPSPLWITPSLTRTNKALSK